ncbi:hypothetical protein PLICRDRAFT_171216 [Plicaturopsis crispa FD-325 SS-3]|nr:hypothetical protein PLICRDRAFT_171216 [Plicaturopsis crispa FD-325 SS-3]
MNDPFAAPFPAVYPYADDPTKSLLPQVQQQQEQENLDFLSFNSTDITLPDPELFESELDLSLAGFDDTQLQLFEFDTNEAFNYYRTDTPTRGPPSAITASSESTHDSVSSRSESYYNFPNSYDDTHTNYSFPIELEMDFQRIHVDPSSIRDYSATAQANNAGTIDPASFAAISPVPARSPVVSRAAASYERRGTYSDYGPSTRASGNNATPDYYSQFGGALVQPSDSPSSVTSQLPAVPTVPSARRTHESEDSLRGDSKKRYKCDHCPRAFARAYNLKTHLATHDPHRPKPHVCPHRSCGRSFSRKHDLGRHLVSIHQDDSVTSSHNSNASTRSIGVASATRGWCETCGKGWVGANRDCTCAVK